MKKVLTFIWGMLKNNLLLKVMAVLFAVVLWSYVIALTNPVREKPLNDVAVRYDFGQLDANGLAISNSETELVLTVDVKVKVNQSYLKTLTNEAVKVSVDLTAVTGTGEKTLNINAVATNPASCTVVDWSPRTVTLTVDRKVNRTIPVAMEVVGSVPDGYYASDPVAEPDTVTISGASADVEKASRAVCSVDVSGLMSWEKKSMDVMLLDSEGNELSSGMFGALPSVIVDMTILPKKTVKVDAASSILGQDSIAPGYHIPDGGIVCNPAYVDIVGEASVLSGISTISLIPYPITGASSDIVVPMDFDLPEGVTVLYTDKPIVTITIREETRSETFEGVSIDIRNTGKGLAAQLSQVEVDVMVTAGLSAMSRLRSSDIVPYVDLNGLDAGTYTVDVLFEIPEGFSRENFPSNITVTVTIARG
jgi:YbbR domain-containing protein